MEYFFNTPEQEQEMLAAIGVDSIDELFQQIPANQQLKRELDLPAPLAEMELEAELKSLAAKNVGAENSTCFLGGGAYDHFVPAVVDEISGRGEYYTAYTPYQAEASQGTLQTFFEYQTLICQLTGMDASNASLYEGATAISEAAFMAMRVTRRHKKIVLLGTIHPEYRSVVRTYHENLGTEIVEVPMQNGVVDIQSVLKVVDDQTACVAFQQPNFFGCLEQVDDIVKIAHDCGALAVCSFDPVSLGILKRPGDYDVDIAVAEGQGLGIPLQFGGPYLGILACREEYVRKMPGRLIGTTTDRMGNHAYVLNLQAREQHIRRDKATSNICTNQGLLALRATIYMSLMGPTGIRNVADLSFQKAHYAADQLTRIDGIQLAFDKPFFKEFTLQCDFGANEFVRRAANAGFQVGPELAKLDASRDAREVLVAVTEKRTKEDIDRLVDAIQA